MQHSPVQDCPSLSSLESLVSAQSLARVQSHSVVTVLSPWLLHCLTFNSIVCQIQKLRWGASHQERFIHAHRNLWQIASIDFSNRVNLGRLRQSKKPGSILLDGLEHCLERVLTYQNLRPPLSQFATWIRELGQQVLSIYRWIGNLLQFLTQVRQMAHRFQLDVQRCKFPIILCEPFVCDLQNLRDLFDHSLAVLQKTAAGFNALEAAENLLPKIPSRKQGDWQQQQMDPNISNFNFSVIYYILIYSIL